MAEPLRPSRLGYVGFFGSMLQLACSTDGGTDKSGAGASVDSGTDGGGEGGSDGEPTPNPCEEPPEGMSCLPAQTVVIGCTEGQVGCNLVSLPQLQVELTRDVLFDRMEFTQRDYESLLGTNPALHSDCPTCPVEQVSWHMALAAANARSVAEGLTPCFSCSGEGSDLACEAIEGWLDCPGFRLPTEAEWEAMARCGDDLTFSGSAVAEEVGWVSPWSEGVSHPVGELAPNACAAFDFTGNVYEWVWDGRGDYPDAPVTDPVGPDEVSEYRMVRGGSWAGAEDHAAVSDRVEVRGTSTEENLGFRLVRSLP
jgi:sulfatase modifying factor 1